MVGDNLLSLLFGGYEKHFLALLCDIFEGGSSFFEFSGCLIEVDDVDTVALHEDVGRHGRVPFSFEVAEMASCLEELVKCGVSHNCKICLRSF